MSEGRPWDAIEEQVALAERAVMDALFGDVGRSDPHTVLKRASIPGTRYEFVHVASHDRRLASPRVPESPDLLIQLLARLMPRLPVEQRTGGDLAGEFAEPLPFTVKANVLGVEPEWQAWLREAMATMGRGFASQRSRPPVDAANSAAHEMMVYFDDLIRRRAAEPHDDLASVLADGAQDPESRQDPVANCIVFILAGHATTTTVLCAGLDLLVARPA